MRCIQTLLNMPNNQLYLPGQAAVPRHDMCCSCDLNEISPALQTEMVQRLSGGAQSGRAAAAEKSLEKIKEEGTLVEKPFVARRRSFA